MKKLCSARIDDNAVYIPLDGVMVHQRELQNVEYTWSLDDSKFYVMYAGRFREAQSIDFEFNN